MPAEEREDPESRERSSRDTSSASSASTASSGASGAPGASDFIRPPDFPGRIYAYFPAVHAEVPADPAVPVPAFWSQYGDDAHRLSRGHLDDGDYEKSVFERLYDPVAMRRKVTRRERRDAILGCLRGFIRAFGPGTRANATVIPASGTLLGVIRNGRWIPWDTDVDLLLRMWEYPALREAAISRRRKSSARGEEDCIFLDHATFLSPLSGGWITRIPARVYVRSTGHFIDLFGLMGSSDADEEFTHLLSRATIRGDALGGLRPCEFEGIKLTCYEHAKPILAAEGLCGERNIDDCDLSVPDHVWSDIDGDFVKRGREEDDEEDKEKEEEKEEEKEVEKEVGKEVEKEEEKEEERDGDSNGESDGDNKD